MLLFLGLTLQLANWFAVNCDKYSEEPQIGKVTAVQEQSIIIEWLIGTYTGVWRQWKKGENISDDIEPKDVVRRNVKLTKANRLSPSMVTELKAAYQKL